jgi:hypothetical protein
MTLHSLVYHENACQFESKDRLGEVFVLRHEVHDTQSCYQYVIKNNERQNTRQGMSNRCKLDDDSQYFNKVPWN